MSGAQTVPHSEQAFTSLVDGIYDSRMLPQAGGPPVPMNCWIPRDEGELLYRTVRRLRPDTTIEIGLANGLSTLFITAALTHNAHGQHIAIDPFQTSEWQNKG